MNIGIVTMANRKQFEDPSFIKKLRSKDNHAFHLLIDAYSDHLYKTARGMGFDDHDAKDLTSNSFVTLLEIIEKFRGDSHIRTFLFGIFYRKVFEYRRTLKKHTNYETLDDVKQSYFDETGHWQESVYIKDPAKFSESLDNLKIIENCLGGVSDSQKAAFTLKVIEERDNEEICHILGITYTNMRKLIARARVKLRACIEESMAS